MHKSKKLLNTEQKITNDYKRKIQKMSKKKCWSEDKYKKLNIKNYVQEGIHVRSGN